MSDLTSTQEQKLSSLSGQMVYVSDTHIQTMDDNRGKLLLDLISRIDPENTKYFILNGDIFDFCFGATDYFRHKFASLGTVLTELASHGVEVIYVEGNHEFQLQDIGWQGVKIVKDEDVILDVDHGVTIKIAHGDLIKKDLLYFAYRGLVKSRVFSFLAQLFPSKWVDAFALNHASQSRKRDEYRSLNHKPLLLAANEWVGSESHGIFGHFHTPYAEPKSDGKGLLICVESWDLPNALIYQNNGFQRVMLKGVGDGFNFEPLKPILD